MRSYNANDQTNEHNIVKPIDEDRSFTGNVQTRGVTGWSGRYTERPDRTSMTFSIEGNVSTECSHGRCLWKVLCNERASLPENIEVNPGVVILSG